MDNVAVACGVAAAISSIFHAPIAGILFAQEVILRHFSLRALAPMAVASIVGYVAANTILPQPPLLQIESAEILHFWEFGLFLLLGMASALVAVAYMQSILWVGLCWRRIQPRPADRQPVRGLVRQPGRHLKRSHQLSRGGVCRLRHGSGNCTGNWRPHDHSGYRIRDDRPLPLDHCRIEQRGARQPDHITAVWALSI